jgi:hypothetical protein
VKWFSAFITCGGRKMDNSRRKGEGRRMEEFEADIIDKLEFVA